MTPPRKTTTARHGSSSRPAVDGTEWASAPGVVPPAARPGIRARLRGHGRQLALLPPNVRTPLQAIYERETHGLRTGPIDYVTTARNREYWAAPDTPTGRAS